MKTKLFDSLLLSSALLLLSVREGRSFESKNFLSAGPGAVAAATGQAFTSRSDDTTAIYYNPAGLPFQRGSFYAEHTPVFGGGRYNFIGFHYPSQFGSFGLGVIQYATDGIETRQTVGDSPSETSASQTAWFLPWASKWKDTSFGLTLKKIENDLGDKHGSGYGLDTGAIYSRPLNAVGFLEDPSVRLGISVKNLVEPSVSMISVNERFPREYTLGVSMSAKVLGEYKTSTNEMVFDKITFSVDDVNPSLSRWPLRYGVQYLYKDLVSFRAGVDKDFTFGIGYDPSLSPFHLDYGILMSDLAPQHRFSFSYFFTDGKPEPVISSRLRKYMLAERDADRYREQLVAEGKEDLRKLDYNKAATNFENALVLDPSNIEIKTYLDRSREASQLQAVRRQLDQGKIDLAQKNLSSVIADSIQLSTTAPLNPQVRDFIANVRASLTAANSAALASFETSIRQEMDSLHATFHAEASQKNVRECRAISERTEALSPASPVTDHLRAALKELEVKTFNGYLDEATVALAKKDYGQANLCYVRAGEIFPENNDLKNQWAGLKDRFQREAGFKNGDSLYQSQLYKVTALHYVKGEMPECLRELNELLAKNPIHDDGNFLRQILADKKIIREEGAENEQANVNGVGGDGDRVVAESVGSASLR